MAEQKHDTLLITLLTIAEIRRKILEKAVDTKRKALDNWFIGPDGSQTLFAVRILPFDERAGLIWARLMSDGKTAGRPRSGLNMIFAATAEANGCIVVTDNEMGLSDFEFINPMRRVVS